MQGLGTLTASPGRGFQKVGCLCRAGKGLGLGELCRVRFGYQCSITNENR